MEIKQYHFYEIDLTNSTENSRFADIVYGAVLSPNEMNEVLKTVIVAPLCNHCSITPTTFLIDEITRIRLDQIMTVEKSRITKRIDQLDNSQIPKIKNVLNEMFVK